MANLRRYTLPMVLAIIALALLVVGILSLTVWKPQQEVVAQRSTQQPYTMTREGVLSLYADEVVVRATAEDNQRVWLAVGSPDDVNAWLQDESYDEIVGLSTLTELKATPHVAEVPPADTDTDKVAEDEVVEEGEAAGDLNPIPSDMWTAVKYGTGSVTLVLSGDELQDSILAATDGSGPAPTIELTWQTPQPNVLAVAAFVLAAVFAFLAFAVWLVLFSARNRRLARSLELERLPEEDVSETTVMQAVPAAVTAPTEPRIEPGSVTEAEEAARIDDADSLTAEEEAIEEVVVASEEQAEEAVAATEGPDASDPVAADTADAVEEQAEFEAPEEAHEETRDETDVEVAGVDEADVVERDEKPEEEAGDASADLIVETPDEAAEVAAEQVETVSTDSGMLNLAALRGGGAFPTRRALREAQERGVDALVVEGRRFSTERPLGSETSAEEDSTPEDVLRKRSLSGLSWSALMRKSSSKKQDGDN